MLPDDDKIVFVICPIGDDDSPARKKSDLLMKFIIQPVTELLGYSVERADTIMESGTITSQVFERLVTAPVVIADMTGHNPNVFYELAVRHAVGQPVIHIISKGESIPFDVAPQRALMYELDLEPVEAAKASLTKMLQAIENNTEEPDSPISNALTRVELARSVEPADRRDSEILATLSDIRSILNNLRLTERNQPSPSLVEFTRELERFSAVHLVTLSHTASLASLHDLILAFFDLTDSILEHEPDYRSVASETMDPAVSGQLKAILGEIMSRLPAGK